MLGEARPEPIGMSCGAHMDTAYSLELYVMSCQTYLEYSRETEEKGRRNLCTNVATSVAYSSFKELKQMCTTSAFAWLEGFARTVYISLRLSQRTVEA